MKRRRPDPPSRVDDLARQVVAARATVDTEAARLSAEAVRAAHPKKRRIPRTGPL